MTNDLSEVLFFTFPVSAQYIDLFYRKVRLIVDRTMKLFIRGVKIGLREVPSKAMHQDKNLIEIAAPESGLRTCRGFWRFVT